MPTQIVTCFAALIGLAFTADAARGEPLRAGVAVVDITPPVPYRMSGYFSERLSTGMLDPLLAKAVVFEQGRESAAILFCDVIAISLDVSNRARERAARATGIPAKHIAIAATHSHTGPLYTGALRERFHRKAVEENGSDPYEKVDYPDVLVDKLVSAVREAKSVTQPVQLAAGYARENRLSFNRRFHMKNGTVRFNPGQLNPNIVRAAGPIDSGVGIVRLTAAAGDQPFAAIVSFAMHLDTVGGTKYSADYPKHLQDRLQETFGRNFTSLFGTGTCGDINHIDVTIRGRRSAAEIGAMLAESVRKQMPKLTPVVEPSLAVRSEAVNAPLQSYRQEQVEAARKKMELVTSRKLPFLERVEAYKISALQLREGNTAPIEVQVFRLGSDVAIVTLPGEVFVELGMAIKQASPFKTTLVIELTNDAPGYIPTQKAFVEGSYETVNSRIRTGGGEKMVATAVRLLKELKTAEN